MMEEKKTLLVKDKLLFQLILFIFLKRSQIGTGMTKSVLRSNESYKEGQLGAFLLLSHNTTKWVSYYIEVGQIRNW